MPGPGHTIEIKALQLAGGISKQPAHERFPGQCEDANNANFSLVDGASKRPGSILIKQITGGSPALVSGYGYRLHPINRSSTEKYLVVHRKDNATLRVFHIDGTEATVSGLSNAAATYFGSGSAGDDDLRFVSIADYTIIANTKVALGVSTTPTFVTTAQWANYDQMTSHTPTTLVGSAYGYASGLAFAAGTMTVTSVGHGLTTGQQVTFQSNTGYPALSGPYTITVTGVDTFTFALSFFGTIGATGYYSTPTLVASGTGDNTYHRTQKDSASEPAGYYKYAVSGTTFPTMQFPVTTKTTADFAPNTQMGFRIRFDRTQCPFTNATWRNVNTTRNLGTNGVGSITNASPPVVTTAASHGYVDGEQVTFYGITGATALNAGVYYVKSLTATTFSVYADAALLVPAAAAGVGTANVGTALCKGKILTLKGAWATYTPQAGDNVYVGVGTGWSAGWNAVAVKVSDNSLNLTQLGGAAIAIAGSSDVSGGGIGQEYSVKFNGTGGQMPTMHDVALFIQQQLQAAGAEDALIEWTDVAGDAGYMTITGPWRGSGALVTVVTANPSSNGSTVDLSSAGWPFYATGTITVNGTGTGTSSLPVDQRWTRVAAPGDADGTIDATKAPIKLYRDTVGPPATFKYDVIPWNSRTSGTDTTNPTPSIFKKARFVSDIGFHRQRFLIAAGESVVFSAANDLFRFYLDDATNLVDSDPIDAPMSSDRVTIIDFVTPVRDTILVTTLAGQQYALGAPDILSPSTVSFTKATTLQTLRTRPVVLDPTLYMATASGGKSQLREAFFVDQSVPTDAADVSAHVTGSSADAGLLPSDIQTIAAHANSRTVFLLPRVSASMPNNVLYIYKSFWSGPRKEQSSWTKWTFDAGYRICDIAVIDDYLYMLVESPYNSGQFTLEKVPIFEPSVGNYAYTIHLDRQMELTGVHTGGTPGITTWTLPTTLSDLTIDSVAIRGSVYPLTGTSSAGTPSTFAVAGDYSATPATVGRSYTFSLTLSEPYPTDYQAKVDYQRAPELGLKMLQKRVSFVHARSGKYDVLCDYELSSTSTFSFTPTTTPTDQRGFFCAWAMADLSRATVRIQSTAATPVTIAGYTHYGDWAVRFHGP